MGLSDHGKWAQATGTSKGPRKVNEALKALSPDERKLLLEWLHDPEEWPANRIARALQQMAKEEGREELLVFHSNVMTWRLANGIKQPVGE